MKGPSKFTIPALSTDDEIWEKILEQLPTKDQNEADKGFSEINEPYLGGKEVIVRRIDKSTIAFASISENHKNDAQWAVYIEN